MNVLLGSNRMKGDYSIYINNPYTTDELESQINIHIGKHIVIRIIIVKII